MTFTEEQASKLQRAEEVLGYSFSNKQLILSAITHPSATEGRAVKYSYERLEFLGDSILGAIVADVAFERFHELDEGGLDAHQGGARVGRKPVRCGVGPWFRRHHRVRLLGDGHGQARPAFRARKRLRGRGGRVVPGRRRGGGARFHLPHAYPAHVRGHGARAGKPRSALQERLQEDGITPTYKLVETQGPPHDRTFVAQVFAGNQGLARGTGRTKKEAESQAAKSTLSRLGEFFGLGMDEQARAEKAAAAKQAKADKAAARAEEKARKKHERELHKSMKQG